jgi:hypothetical protein
MVNKMKQNLMTEPPPMPWPKPPEKKNKFIEQPSKPWPIVIDGNITQDLEINGDINQIGDGIDQKIDTLNLHGNLNMEGNLTVNSMSMQYDEVRLRAIVESYLLNRKKWWQFWK